MKKKRPALPIKGDRITFGGPLATQTGIVLAVAPPGYGHRQISVRWLYDDHVSVITRDSPSITILPAGG